MRRIIFARADGIMYRNCMDVHTPEARRRNMQAIRAKNTKPEMIVRRYLHSHGFRYRLHVPDLPGKPDIVLPRYRTAVFVHGCFWHMHECELFHLPQTRSEWWKDKLEKNRVRDERNIDALRVAGWNVIVVWECELKTADRDSFLEDLCRCIKENKP